MPRVLLAFEPPDGGVAENVAQLALGLEKHGWTAVVAGPPESIIYERVEAAGIEVTRLPFTRGLREPWAEARALIETRKLIGDGAFDLIHACSSKAGALGRTAALGKVPSVYSPHCFAFIGDVGRARRSTVIVTERLLGKITAGLICVCEDERRQAIRAKIAPPERLFRVTNGVEAPPVDLQPHRDLAALRAKGPVVGAIAVLRRQKRLDLLIAATPRILARHPDTHVVIVGNGPEQADLESRAAELGLDRETRFQMLPFRDSSWPDLAGLDVFVLPSQWEGLPIAALEALACGVPQVATAINGTPEAVVDGETGFLVHVDAEEIAVAVTKLLDYPDLRERMARASRKRYAENFTLERVVEETAAVYDAVANR
jgi:glycosyltransferase involved in cell wall biosynthesis